MPWARLDDNFPYHPKTLRAIGLVKGRERLQRVLGQYVAGLLYCNKYLTDGFIPSDEVTLMQGDALAETLVHVGLWEVVDGGFQIHDFHHHNDSADDVKARRDADRERKRLARGGVSSDRRPTAVQPPSNRTASGQTPDTRPRVGAPVGPRAGTPAGVRTVPVPGLKSKDKSTAFGGPRAIGPVKTLDPAVDADQAYQTRMAEAEANYKVILRLAHEVIGFFGVEPEADITEAIKERCAQARITYNSRVVQKAYDAAKHSRAKEHLA